MNLTEKWLQHETLSKRYVQEFKLLELDHHYHAGPTADLLIQIIDELTKEEPNNLSLIFKETIHDGNIIYLAFLIEFARAQGFFYSDDEIEKEELLEIILLQALTLIENQPIENCHLSLWYILEVFDIIFHQINFTNFPEKFADLYFKLCTNLLDINFYVSQQNKNIQWLYDGCLYFLEMADGWFASRPKEFIFLWKQIESQINKTGGYAWEDDYWPAKYRALSINPS